MADASARWRRRRGSSGLEATQTLPMRRSEPSQQIGDPMAFGDGAGTSRLSDGPTAVEIDGVGTSTDRQPMRLLVDGVTRCGPRLDDTVRMGHGRRLCPMARPAAVGGATQRPMAEQQRARRWGEASADDLKSRQCALKLIDEERLSPVIKDGRGEEVYG
jgi:hypothetical protein